MTSKWQQLLPHYLGMLVVYVVLISLVAVLFDQRNFWISLGIALVIALTYPSAVRSLGIAPEPWE